jgi:DNA-binding beta-propeller fold protein YncE
MYSHLFRAGRSFAFATCLLACGTAAAAAQGKDYLVFVASEAVDKIALVRFGPAGAKVEREIRVGLMPTEPDGPHGLAVSPDGKSLFVTTAHGQPFGYLWKYDAATGRVVRRVELGNFPASMQISPDGWFAYVVNFNLHGDMVPSSVSIVAVDSMLEVARVPTCVMPHGSRINPQGTLQYSTCMMNDLLVEIDTRTFAVSRHFMLAKGDEHGDAGAPHVEHHTMEHGATAPTPHPALPPASCSPTWAQPSADGARVFVACNKSNDIVEIDAATWTMKRRIPAGEGVYNLTVTHDDKLLIGTNKRGQSVSIFDVASGKELARVATQRKVVHGVVVSPDDRYAFVSVEGIGAEPGTLEVIDLAKRARVASVDLGQMAGGIDFWKIEGR